jgi:hypothetical protein
MSKARASDGDAASVAADGAVLCAGFAEEIGRHRFDACFDWSTREVAMKSLLVPNRQRDLQRPFGWVPLDLFSAPAWAQLSVPAKLLYLVLCVVSDRRGLSYYSDLRLCRLSGIEPPALRRARAELIAQDLLAEHAPSQRVQVLSLPMPQPNTAASTSAKSADSSPSVALAASLSAAQVGDKVAFAAPVDRGKLASPDLVTIRKFIATLSNKMAR